MNSLNGDLALMSKSGKGLIRLDHKLGIEVYPPSYQLDRVFENTIYQVQAAAATPHGPCSISYFADDVNAAPKVIKSSLDCASLIQQVDSNEIFSENIPDKL